MRPLRLDMAGFTVFRDETTVDFTDADFFALVGPTGAGKSTVLDAICFALYGQVPRWGSSRGIANALSPSATEARVRLVFESAGARYVATRVVRRDSRGNVKTGGAGLQQMPDNFDVSKLDTGMTPEDLGDVLAGTPGEMDDAVLQAVGLPYEQFTSCVILPQGQFADFLHAKPATRQQILVNLLGLHVYEDIQKRATARAQQADADLRAVDQLLAGLDDTSDEALAEAADRVEAMLALATRVTDGMPALDEARRVASAAAAGLTALDDEIALLERVRAPRGVAALASAAAAARDDATEAADAVTAAEEREEKLRGELAAAGDPAALRLLLRAHEEHDAVRAELSGLHSGVSAATAEHRTAEAALEKARAAALRTAAELDAARRAYQDAQAADRAGALRVHLHAGAPCPVCEQPVATVPAVPSTSAVPAAEQAGHAAKAADDKAQAQVAEREKAARALERTLDRARAQHEQLESRLAALDAQLTTSPGVAALRRELATLAALQKSLDGAVAALKSAREQARTANAARSAAEQRLTQGWREFDTARDGVARFAPPAAAREDLAESWSALAEWSAAEVESRRVARTALADAAADADAAVADARSRLDAAFVDAGLPAPDDHVRAATVAVERATAAHQRVEERRAQAQGLLDKRTAHEHDGQIAKSLASHLRANNFERWLLEEALDLLVEGASRILRELSGGQYDLVHEKGEFSVVDHHDAGLRRGVRTLSGGETFQASLALALALAEQLAGMSTSAASLESILLDEGFGTLDAATLDTVAATLEGLAARGDRMVGVVTHVPALAERVPVRFDVTKDARSAHITRSGI
ncbi:SMC family ATPase [Asanoa sp. WMMD1127]|uniref:AAA family ATPase n=1 Tax=Asanoa sp. WMMD1127 TaxID=3016107 RepID=UPI002417B3E2|nr:SMC family ATPase [Asanoa sp. WMMD1127]MDG4823841.1 SMC family ATPase [Asanoa sp. WMMD1127]